LLGTRAVRLHVPQHRHVQRHERLVLAEWSAARQHRQLLRQPRYCKSTAVQAEYRRAQRHERATARCHVAFVDWQSERLLKQVQAAELERERAKMAVSALPF
jgi:hypothetical protein